MVWAAPAAAKPITISDHDCIDHMLHRDLFVVAKIPCADQSLSIRLSASLFFDNLSSYTAIDYEKQELFAVP
jgi:hypothetical protein